MTALMHFCGELLAAQQESPASPVVRFSIAMCQEFFRGTVAANDEQGGEPDAA